MRGRAVNRSRFRKSSRRTKTWIVSSTDDTDEEGKRADVLGLRLICAIREISVIRGSAPFSLVAAPMHRLTA